MAWFWVITQPHRERRVSSAMASLQINHHLFKIRNQCILRHAVFTRLLCAFPRYIVVDLDNEFGVVRSVDGVTGFITFEGYPRVFPDYEFERLRWMADDDDVLNIDDCAQYRFKRGDKVHIDNGTAFSGHDANFEYLLPGGNAVVMIELMGQPVPISVSEKDLFEVQPERKNYRSRKRRHKRRARNDNHKFVELHAKAA